MTSIPALQLATWLLQVMPLFFVAGQLLGQPLWFLGVYVAMTVLAPAMVAWHTHSPRIALAMLVIGAVVMDWFRLGAGVESVGYVNLAFVWLFAQQLGFAYADGSFTRLTRRTLWVTIICVFATLAVLTSWGPYPVSMVGLPGETSNMTPPTICLSMLAVAQVAIMMLIRGKVSGWLRRPAPWAAVVRFASIAMTVYLWHLSVLVIAFLTLFGLGIDPPAAGSELWWLTRPFWLFALALVLWGVATVLARLERGKATKVKPTTTPFIMATTVSGVGATLISFGLLGYVASGLRPAPLGSSTLLFIPVDPVQNTFWVLVGFALSAAAARWSRH